MRAWTSVIAIGIVTVVRAATAGAEARGSFEACRQQLQQDECAPCLADKPTSAALCDLQKVTDCLQRLQADVEWFDALLARDQARLSTLAKQQARVLDLLNRIRDNVGPGNLWEIDDLVDKLREEVAGKETRTSGDEKTDRAPQMAADWREAVEAFLVPHLRQAGQRLAALRASVAGDRPPTREVVLADLRTVSDALWEAASASGAIPAPPAKAKPVQRSWGVLLPDSGVQACSDTGERTLIDDGATAYLFSAYHAYHTLKARLKALKKAGDTTPPDAFDKAERERKVVQALMHRALRRKGYDEPINGVLAGGVGFTRAPDKTGQSAAQSAQSLVVRFESKHLPMIGNWVDAGLMGKFGVQPSFDVLKPPDPSKFTRDVVAEQTGPNEFTRVTSEQSITRLLCPKVDSPADDCTPAAPPGFATKYADSFVWDAGGRMGVDPFGLAELSAFVRAGQTHPLPEFVVVKNDANQPVAATLLGTTSDSRWYHEYGARFVVYRQRSNREAHGVGALTPLLEAEGGWRVDRRFKDRPKDFPVEEFGDHPERRLFLRFALNGLSVLGGGDTPFLVSFAVEWEGKRDAKGLASGTKIYVQGNLDLNKLFASK